MSKFQLPHFYRRIAAPFIFAIFLTLIVLNLFHTSFFGFTKEKEIKLQIMSFPKISSFHEELGQLYLSQDKKRAEDEYLLAGEYYSVLGLTTGPIEKWDKIVNQDDQINNNLEYWQRISTLWPDYYFAKLKIASLYSELGKTEEAKSVLEDLKKNPVLNLNLSI